MSHLRETAETTTSVMFIVCAASIFGWILSYEQVPQSLALVATTTIHNKYLLLFILNIFLLVVGCFMDSTVAIIILTPVLLPIVTSYGVSPVHFGIIMILNLMIGLMTPPVGMVLFVLSKVSNVPFEKISKAILPYLGILVSLLLVFTYCPIIVEFLPNLIFGPM